MRQIEQEIPAIDIVDVDVVVVGPAMRPRVHNFKIVTAVSKVRTPSDNRDVLDCKMMVVAEVGTKMGIVNPFVLGRVLIMMLLLPGIVVMLIMVVVLRQSGHCPAQQKRATDTAYCQESLHSESSLMTLFWKFGAPNAPWSPE
jgi:hypothetical protein